YEFQNIKTSAEVNYKWTEINRELMITDYLGYEQEIEIPSRIGIYPVKGIESEAFKGKGLSSVTIPDTITFIGGDAFVDNQSNPSDLTIVGHDPSIAKDYADENGHTFKNIYANDYDWHENSDGTLTITKYKGTEINVSLP